MKDFLLTLINLAFICCINFLISIKKLNISKKIISNICLFHTLLYAIIGTLFILKFPTIEIQVNLQVNIFQIRCIDMRGYYLHPIYMQII